MTEKFIEECIVILGLNLRDATDEYRRLLAQEPERVSGRRVVICGTGFTPHKLLGLKVHDWTETSGACRGRNYSEAKKYIKIGGLRAT